MEYEKLSDHAEAGKRVENLDERIYSAIAETKTCNHREKLFG